MKSKITKIFGTITPFFATFISATSLLAFSNHATNVAVQKTTASLVTATTVNNQGSPHFPFLPDAVTVDKKTGFVWVGTFTNGLWFSSDGGTTFNKAPVPYATPDQGGITSVSVTNSGAICVSTPFQGVFMSYDNGKTFTPWKVKTPLFAYKTYVDSAGNIWVSAIKDGVFISRDNGHSFTSVAGLPQNLCTYSFTEDTTTKTVFLSTGFHGVFETHNFGQSFVNLAAGLPTETAFITSSFNPSNHTLWFGTSLSGLWYKTVKSAQFIHNTSVTPGNAYCMTTSVSPSGTVVLGTMAHGLWISKPNTPVFTQVKQGVLPNFEIASTAFGGPHTLWVGTKNNALWVSTDNGQTFHQRYL